LQKIDLAANKLSCVSSRAFAGLSSLFFLNLEGNNLLCKDPSWPSFTRFDANLEPCLNETQCDNFPTTASASLEIPTTASATPDIPATTPAVPDMPTTTPTGPPPRTWTLHPDYLRCRIQHDWREIVASELATNHTITMGGLGKLMVRGRYEVWVCSHEDSCARPRNAFCYVFDEEEKKFIPWGLEDELMLRKEDR